MDISRSGPEVKPPPAVRPIKSNSAPAVEWRPYQRHAVNAAVLALKAGKAALLVLPTGSGKSLNAADAARRAHFAGLRTLILAPSRELVQQDAAAVTKVTGNTVMPSLACAGIGPVDLDGAVVIGTPQTLVRRLEQLGRVDLLVVDEAHRLGRKSSGQIHTILAELRRRNPKLMLLGLTATPFRLDTGRLTEGEDRLFEVIAFQVGYLDLVAEKYLAPLIGPRDAIERLNVAGLRIVGGDYAASDLARFDRDEITERIADQIVAHGVDRKSWLIFAVGIKHAERRAQRPRGRFQGRLGPVSRRLRRVLHRLRRADRRPDRDCPADLLAGLACAELRSWHAARAWQDRLFDP